MKRATLILAILFAMSVRAADKPKVDVSKIHSPIQLERTFPDYKMKAGTSFRDLRVEPIIESGAHHHAEGLGAGTGPCHSGPGP